MRKFLASLLMVLVLTGTSIAGTLAPFAFPFIGKWQPCESSLLLDDYGLQDIQNLRKDGKRFKGVNGHTAITTSIPSTGYDYIYNGFHFIKDQPSESHMIIYAANSTPTAGALFDNTTVIPGTGNNDPVALYIPSYFNNVWRFSSAPAGNMVASNGDETLIWGGDEIEATSFVTSSAAVTYTLTNANDYTDLLNNTRQTSDQVVTLSTSGGIDDYTKLMLHFDGADTSTTFTDSSASVHVMTAGGTAQLDTAQFKWGTASGLFDGNSDYLTTPSDADFQFGTGDFTVDFWYRCSDLTNAQAFVSQYIDGNNYWRLSKSTNADGNKLKLQFLVGGVVKANYIMTDASALVINTWYHLAFVRNGSTIKIFINGTSQTLTETTAINANDVGVIAAVLNVGYMANDEYLAGWMDELRISKGVARWTSDFTVPTQAYGNSNNIFLVGSKRQLQGIKVYVLSGNTVTSTMTMKEWQGTAWTAVTITDNTDTGASLAQTGTITWTYTGNAKKRYLNGLSLYWYQFTLDAGSASIYYVTTDAPIQAISNIWDGVEQYLIKCLKYDGTTYKDYTDDVSDGSDSTYLDLSSFATTHALYLGFLEPQQAFSIKLVAGAENGDASVMSVNYWSGSAWVTVTAFNDGTDSGGDTIAKGGVITFQAVEPGSEFKRAISDEFPLYYYQIVVSVNLDADVKVAEITGISSPESMSTFTFSETFQNRLFLFNEKSGSKNKAIYSVANAPDIFNGTDTGEIVFGDKTELTAAAVVYNVFTDSAVEQLLVTKKNETWRVSGDTSDDWTLKRISSNIGCIAPLSMVSAEVMDSGANVKRTVAIWVSDQGPVMSSGASVIPIYDDVRCYWDPNDSRYIPTTMQTESIGRYDPRTRSYKLLIASGAGSTYLNTELEFSLVYNEWTKIYREDAGGANPLQSVWGVWDTNGLGYSYGGGKDGIVYRLENGNDWNNEADITSYIHTKDLILDTEMPLFRKSTVKYFRTMYEQKDVGDITISHYGDGSQTTSGVSGQVGLAVITNAASTHYNTQSCNLGQFLFHSFKFSATTDVTDGLELTGFGLYHDISPIMR